MPQEMKAEVRKLEKSGERKKTEKIEEEDLQLNIKSLSISAQSEGISNDSPKLGLVQNENKCVQTVGESVQSSGKDMASVERNSSECEKTLKTSDTNVQSKMDRLMALLDKRKSLLGKMAQIETVADSKVEAKGGDKTKRTDVEHSFTPDSISCDKGKDTKAKIVSSLHTCQHAPDVNKSGVNVEEKLNVATEKDVVGDNRKETNTTKTAKSKRMKCDKTLSVSVLKLICQSVKQWVTTETRQYLKVCSVPEERNENNISLTSEMEEKYRQLCHKLDTEETELDLIGTCISKVKSKSLGLTSPGTIIRTIVYSSSK